MKQNIIATLICLFFVGIGIFALYSDGPSFGAWILIMFFGIGSIILPVTIIYEKKTGKPLQLFKTKYSPSSSAEFTLKDGRSYKVQVDDDLVTLINKETNEKKEVAWQKLTNVFFIAIDDFPVGKCSYVLHQENVILEVPINAEGSEQLLEAMQNKLPGFDNNAVLEAMGMLHGHKQLWSKNKNGNN